MKQYASLASVYDRLNYGCDYEKIANFLASEIKENERVSSSLVLDLACGTGRLTFLLRDRGFDMTGIDLSEEMLSQAKALCHKEGVSDILWLCQDMRSFELYGTVDACVCTLDSINYLTKLSDVKKCFSLVHNYLIPDGVFVFDVNTPKRFKGFYGCNDYIVEGDTTLLAWQNDYNEKSKLCKFYLSIFEEQADGSYQRYDEVQTEKCYTKKQIESALLECGFEILHVYGDYEKKNADEHCEKWCFTVRCKK